MHRAVAIVVLAGSLVVDTGVVHADAPRVVTERYACCAGEAPHLIACDLPGAPPFLGFGYGGISFPVRAGERTVDIAIDDDLHDIPVIAFASQSGGYGPDAQGTWICGSRSGIPITTESPVVVFLMQAVTAPPIQGSVRAAFHEH